MELHFVMTDSSGMREMGRMVKAFQGVGRLGIESYYEQRCGVRISRHERNILESYSQLLELKGRFDCCYGVGHTLDYT
ncbi:hypothetical protein Syun_023362 [Stephania yunnanensis]|uniref:Uncharacterized protein n=1 Tax=Stephania yunnanensis TaxID=152371 RepID=A0AAP0F9Q2_9MAGN